jgi:hypothetical protein
MCALMPCHCASGSATMHNSNRLFPVGAVTPVLNYLPALTAEADVPLAIGRPSVSTGGLFVYGRLSNRLVFRRDGTSTYAE